MSERNLFLVVCGHDKQQSANVPETKATEHWKYSNFLITVNTVVNNQIVFNEEMTLGDFIKLGPELRK